MITHRQDSDQEKRTPPGEATDEARVESSQHEYEVAARSLGPSDPPRWMGVWITEALALGFGLIMLCLWLWSKDEVGWAALSWHILLAACAVPTAGLLGTWIAMYWSESIQERKEERRHLKVKAAAAAMPGFYVFYDVWDSARHRGVSQEVANERAWHALGLWRDQWRHPGSPIENGPVMASTPVYHQNRKWGLALFTGALVVAVVGALWMW